MNSNEFEEFKNFLATTDNEKYFIQYANTHGKRIFSSKKAQNYIMINWWKKNFLSGMINNQYEPLDSDNKQKTDILLSSFLNLEHIVEVNNHIHPLGNMAVLNSKIKNKKLCWMEFAIYEHWSLFFQITGSLQEKNSSLLDKLIHSKTYDSGTLWHALARTLSILPRHNFENIGQTFVNHNLSILKQNSVGITPNTIIENNIKTINEQISKSSSSHKLNILLEVNEKALDYFQQIQLFQEMQQKLKVSSNKSMKI